MRSRQLRVAIALVLGVVMVLGCGSKGGRRGRDRTPDDRPAAAAERTPPTTRASSASTGPIPDSAFLAAADVNGDTAPRETSAPVLPTLCRTPLPPTGQAQSRTFGGSYWKGRRAGTQPTGRFVETITTFRAGAATQHLGRIRAAVDGCTTEKVGSTPVNYRVTTGARYGDESFAFTRTVGTDVRVVVVVRIRDAVMILHETGTGAGTPSAADLPTVDRLAGRAVQRMQTWLG